jgi:hypothetical protein
MPAEHSDRSREVASTGWRRFYEFWTTLPGILTGIAAVLGAITALLATTHNIFDNPGGPVVPSTSSTGVVSIPPNESQACSDGVDNDGDGRTDFPDDSNCSSRSDPSEKNAACSDGRDNDRDGKTDFPEDPECASGTDPAEKQ